VQSPRGERRRSHDRGKEGGKAAVTVLEVEKKSARRVGAAGAEGKRLKSVAFPSCHGNTQNIENPGMGEEKGQ